MVKNGNFTFILLELMLADKLAHIPPKDKHLVVKKGNFTFLLLELILVDQLPEIPPSAGI